MLSTRHATPGPRLFQVRENTVLRRQRLDSFAIVNAAKDAPVHRPTHVLYLHGFRSSPHSFKARMLAAWLAQHRPDVTWWCPQLPPSPRDAIALAEEGTASWPRNTRAVLGSSLGGFYATVLAERWGCKAVVMNPDKMA